MKTQPLYVLLLIVAAMVSCSKHKTPEPAPVPVPPPGQSVLLFPAQSSLCVTADFFSPQQSHVTFNWKSAAYTNTYTLTVLNLATGLTVPSVTTSDTSSIVTLDRGAAYSWNIQTHSSKSGVSTTSVSWKFYNPGPGQTSYAPFPADLQSPTFGQTVPAGNVTLTWGGADPDSSDLSYNVYCSTDPDPALFKNGIKVNTLQVSVISGNTYYWKVVTTDPDNNTSESQVFQFLAQ